MKRAKRAKYRISQLQYNFPDGRKTVFFMEDGKIRDVKGPPVAPSDLDIFQDDPNQYNFDSVPDFIFSEEDIIDPINSSLFEY